MADEVRDILDALPDSPVETQLMPGLIAAGVAATVGGFDAGGNIIVGKKIFKTVIDGNNTTSETMNRLNDGINLRLFRVPDGYYANFAQGLHTPVYTLAICFCPTFAFMKDQGIGQESIDRYRERLRLRTLAIYNSKNFKNYRAPQGNQDDVSNNNLFYPTPLQTKARITADVRNIVYEFERSKPVSEGDNWYSAPFTLWFDVIVRDFI